MNPERLPPSLWPVVHRLANGRSWPPTTREEALEFVLRARKERLLPLLFHTVAHQPPVIQKVLNDHLALQRVAESSALLLRSDLETFRTFVEGLSFIVIKGASYALSLYGDFSLRPMQDLDVLVPRELIPEIIRQMREQGKQPVRPAGAAAWTCSYPELIFTMEHTIVEVHQAVVQRSRHSIEYTDIWNGRRPVESIAPNGFRARDADELLLHCLALAKEEFRVRLVHYVDLWLLLQRLPPPSGPEIRETAGRWKVARALDLSMRNLLLVFPESAAFPLVSESGRISRTLRRFVTAAVPAPTDERRYHPSILRKVIVKFVVMDDAAHRVRFLVHHALALVEGTARRLLRIEPWKNRS